jgi:hypothetical protein
LRTSSYVSRGWSFMLSRTLHSLAELDGGSEPERAPLHLRVDRVGFEPRMPTEKSQVAVGRCGPEPEGSDVNVYVSPARGVTFMVWDLVSCGQKRPKVEGKLAPLSITNTQTSGNRHRIPPS